MLLKILETRQDYEQMGEVLKKCKIQRIVSKYNKYAAARHAAREAEKRKGEPQSNGIKGVDNTTLKEALQPKFGKSLGRSAVAQRLASAPKSAALRKTSRNNPANKAKRSSRFKSKGY